MTARQSFAQPLVIREGAWQVTLDTAEPIVQMGLDLGDDMPWVPEALTVLCRFMAGGMSEDEALDAVNVGCSWALLERVQF